MIHAKIQPMASHRLGLSVLITLSALASGCPVEAPYVPPVLQPPPPGRGIQLRVSFEVPPATEQQRCWTFRLPTTENLEVVRYEIAYNTGSHHMNLFRAIPSVEADGRARGLRIPAETGLEGGGVECFNAIEFGVFDLVVGSQESRLDWSLPAGVAYRLHANSLMILQSHFVNGATQRTPGNRAEVLINLWTAENPTQIQNHLGTMFANNRQLNIPPRSSNVAFSRGCDLPQGGTFIAMTGHFHSRGRRFVAFDSPNGVTPGNECYRSTNWSEPPFVTFDGTAGRPAPLTVPPGGGLYYTCFFDNPTNVPITFGPHVDYEEHCNLFAYYYPSDPDSRARYCF
ncbi:MAG: hypothetical protein Q8Q09_28715 [Deltaproteobacteria bacterium]|nr:hypothetical protein [Deltaproteobacteria bacterium]